MVSGRSSALRARKIRYYRTRVPSADLKPSRCCTIDLSCDQMNGRGMLPIPPSVKCCCAHKQETRSEWRHSSRAGIAAHEEVVLTPP